MAETLHPITSLSGFREITSMDVAASSTAATIVEAALLRYQRDAERIMRRPCWVIVTDEVVTDLAGAFLVTRRRPVVSVEAFAPAGVDYVLGTEGLITLTTPGTLSLVGTTSYTVSYTSRLSVEVVEAVTGMIYERAQRWLVKEIDRAQGVSNLSEEGASATYLDTGWTADEREDLLAMRKRSSR